jgi:hypothetical protein
MSMVATPANEYSLLSVSAGSRFIEMVGADMILKLRPEGVCLTRADDPYQKGDRDLRPT